MKWIWPIFYGVNQKLFHTLMTFELFPEIASVKTLKCPRGDAIRVTEQFLLKLDSDEKSKYWHLNTLGLTLSTPGLFFIL